MMPWTAETLATAQAGTSTAAAPRVDARILREQLGSALAGSAARLLGGQGATLTVVTDPDTQIPVGASDALAQTAERFHFTAGEGPGLDAFTTDRPVIAPHAELLRRWPGLAHYLHTRTPYRSVVAAAVQQIGVLTVYYTEPDGAGAVDARAARAVAESIWATAVRDLPDIGHRPPLVAAARRRSAVWVATGMLVAALQVDLATASLLLRARALTEDRTAEDLAADLVGGRLTVDSFRTG